MTTAAAQRIADGQLLAVVERIERLNEEAKTIKDDIADVYTEAKGSGYDVKALRKIVALRKLDPSQRAEEETILQTYMRALGMLVGTPLGDAAIASISQQAMPRSRGRDHRGTPHDSAANVRAAG
jgi:uncharacterized protein (UPF0335 family)